jgi:ergothioneine biosynthesis protein EgtB
MHCYGLKRFVESTFLSGLNAYRGLGQRCGGSRRPVSVPGNAALTGQWGRRWLGQSLDNPAPVADSPSSQRLLCKLTFSGTRVAPAPPSLRRVKAVATLGASANAPPMTDRADTESRREQLLSRYRRVRQASCEMCRPLSPEAYRIQPSDDVSPPWWNLGHTSWFFVRNALEPFGGETTPEDQQLDYLLNSYYAGLGQRLARGRRGLMTRPTTDEVYAYRRCVDRRVEQLIVSIDDVRWSDLQLVITVGLEHEQQHQELFYTEIKAILAQNPPTLRTAYRPVEQGGLAASRPMRFLPFEGGLLRFGHDAAGWCWDNELPAHDYFLRPFALADRLVTNAEFLAFIEDGGYAQQLLWLDNGWNEAQQQAWQAPLYWEQLDGRWWHWTLSGMRPIEPDSPVCHVSFYEADAFARWQGETFAEFRGVRLPSEREWERAARLCVAAEDDAFVESGRLHPAAAGEHERLAQMFGALWQWTASYYEPYPGYRPFAGALAEYNGKFMDNQRVLRGGSCATPREHFRLTYRNFWPAPTRFQFTGIRLARDAAT